MKKTYKAPAMEGMEVNLLAPLCESLSISSLETESDQLSVERLLSTEEKDGWTDGLW